jgi:transcriptional regulator with XRE-family HTH domain
MLKGSTDFGAILRHERELRGWSQQELIRQISALCAADGEYLGLDPRTVGRWEQGKHKPSPCYRKRLCQVFGQNAKQLGFIK